MAKSSADNPKSAEETETERHKNERAEKEREEEEESLNKTIEDSFPASDPPSSIPDPHDDENAA